MRYNYLPAFLSSLVGTALGLVAYAAPFGNTGVDGTPGALLALIGAVATAVGTALALIPNVRHLLLTVLNILVFLAAGLTAIAAYFLMQNVFAIAMLAALLGLLFALAYSRRGRPA